MIELETTRLKLRQLNASDFEHFANFFKDSESAKYVGGIKTKEEAWRLLATYIGHWQLKGYSYMAVEVKTSGQFAGCAGLWNSEPWPELELGYWFLPKMQGQGYASEAVKKVKQFAFDEIKSETLVSYIHAENASSIRLAERIGGIYENTIELLNFGLHSVYRYSN